MTFWEYNIRMKAHGLREVDAIWGKYVQAIATREAQATEKVGKKYKYVYSSADEMYNRRKMADKVLSGIEEENRTSGILNRSLEYRRRKENGEL